jgi:hypothetical protein
MMRAASLSAISSSVSLMSMLRHLGAGVCRPVKTV